jgi:hypothetical protein
MYSSMSKSLVDHILSGLGKLTGTFLEAKLDSNVERLSASCLRSSCWFIIQPKTSTSSGRDSHCIPGSIFKQWAKKDMMRRSRAINLDTFGWRTLMATEAVGTEGRGS